MMSRVMNVILTTGCQELIADRIDEMNAFLRGGDIVCRDVFASVPANLIAGGSKKMECNIVLAAFNYVQEDYLLAAIRVAKWYAPETVQLFIKHEDDEQFTERRWKEAWKVVHQEEGEAVGHVALSDDTGTMVEYMIVGIGPQIGKHVRITVEVQEEA